MTSTSTTTAQASLDTIWDKAIFKGQQLTDIEARAVAELALTVASARQTLQKTPRDGNYDIVRGALLTVIVEKFEARFIDDFLTDDTDETPEVIADDQLLDNLGSATPSADSELAARLLAGRDAVEADPIPDLVDTDTALAVIQAGAA